MNSGMSGSVETERKRSINTSHEGCKNLPTPAARDIPILVQDSSSSTTGDDHCTHAKNTTKIRSDHTIERGPPPQQFVGIREVVGKAMVKFSDVINDHLIAARYGTIATVFLLSAYSLSKTPLFFRFRTVADIPASWFERRQTIKCRLVRLVKTKSAGEQGEVPIRLMVSHLSPAGRLMNRAAFDFIRRRSPSAALGMDESHELLIIELAGVSSIPNARSIPDQTDQTEQTSSWLDGLAESRTLLSCQLLARRIKSNKAVKVEKNVMLTTNEEDTISHDKQVAICHVRYRPGIQFFATDVGLSLVRAGRSVVGNSGLYIKDATTSVVDANSNPNRLWEDASYIEKLGKAEFDAVKESKGAWALESIRDTRKDLVEEAEFQSSASFFQKLWSRFRG